MEEVEDGHESLEGELIETRRMIARPAREVRGSGRICRNQSSSIVLLCVSLTTSGHGFSRLRIFPVKPKSWCMPSTDTPPSSLLLKLLRANQHHRGPDSVTAFGTTSVTSKAAHNVNLSSSTRPRSDLPSDRLPFCSRQFFHNSYYEAL